MWSTRRIDAEVTAGAGFHRLLAYNWLHAFLTD
jgi:hypothetical protein